MGLATKKYEEFKILFHFHILMHLKNKKIKSFEAHVTLLFTCMRVTTTHIGFVKSTFTHLQKEISKQLLHSKSHKFKQIIRREMTIQQLSYKIKFETTKTWLLCSFFWGGGGGDKNHRKTKNWKYWESVN